MYTEGVSEQGAEGDIRLSEGGGREMNDSCAVWNFSTYCMFKHYAMSCPIGW